MLPEMSHETWRERRRELLREAAEHRLLSRTQRGGAAGRHAVLTRLFRKRAKPVAKHEGGLG
ncbi:MAG: hypothetical protein AB1425_07055 [Actinomycetota bacterium]